MNSLSIKYLGQFKRIKRDLEYETENTEIKSLIVIMERSIFNIDENNF